jgi:hypothetical protein
MRLHHELDQPDLGLRDAVVVNERSHRPAEPISFGQVYLCSAP